MAAEEAEDVDDGDPLLSCFLSGDDVTPADVTVAVVVAVADEMVPPSNLSTLKILLLLLAFVGGGVAVKLANLLSLLLSERSCTVFVDGDRRGGGGTASDAANAPIKLDIEVTGAVGACDGGGGAGGGGGGVLRDSKFGIEKFGIVSCP